MRRAAGLVLFVVAWRCVACADDRPTCYAGEYAGCECANGEPGYAACDPARDAWGACICDGTTPGIDASSARQPDASTADAEPGDAGSDAPIADAAACDAAGDCGAP